MTFLTEEQQRLKELTRRFVEKALIPAAKKLDNTDRFPWEWFKECGKIGLLGSIIPKQYGGNDLGWAEHCVVIEEIARASGSLALNISAHLMAARIIIAAGGGGQQARQCLGQAIEGEKLLAFALTETNSGSDLGGIQTTAQSIGDEWVIDGSKSWITNAQDANFYVVVAKTDPERGNRGTSLFIIDKIAPGFKVGKIEKKMGMNNSPTGSLYFDKCKIPRENLLGEENGGYIFIQRGLNEERLAYGAIAVGIAQGALEKALDYARNRIQFGRPIASFQGVAFMLAEMFTKIDVARTMLHRVAKMRDNQVSYTREVAALKLFSSEMCCEVCDDAIQILGGNGYSRDYELERFARDARMLRIGAGTSEILKLVITNKLYS